jgi:hypothetical protein
VRLEVRRPTSWDAGRPRGKYSPSAAEGWYLRPGCSNVATSPGHWTPGQAVRSVRTTVATIPSCKRRTPLWPA